MLNFLKKPLDAAEMVVNHLINTLTLEKGYSALFKAGIVLMSAAMIALSQTGTFLYDKDLSAHKAMYTVESTTGKPINSIDCKKLSKPLNVECLVAKYELDTVSSSLQLLSIIVNSSIVFGAFCIILALVGFVFAPFQKSINTRAPSVPEDILPTTSPPSSPESILPVTNP